MRPSIYLYATIRFETLQGNMKDCRYDVILMPRTCQHATYKNSYKFIRFLTYEKQFNNCVLSICIEHRCSTGIFIYVVIFHVTQLMYIKIVQHRTLTYFLEIKGYKHAILLEEFNIHGKWWIKETDISLGQSTIVYSM